MRASRRTNRRKVGLNLSNPTGPNRAMRRYAKTAKGMKEIALRMAREKRGK
jgi:hypothetical protein